MWPTSARDVEQRQKRGITHVDSTSHTLPRHQHEESTGFRQPGPHGHTVTAGRFPSLPEPLFPGRSVGTMTPVLSQGGCEVQNRHSTLNPRSMPGTRLVLGDTHTLSSARLPLPGGPRNWSGRLESQHSWTEFAQVVSLPLPGITSVYHHT